MLERTELEQLDKAWTVIRIVQAALAGSLVLYLLVCTAMESALTPRGDDLPLETLRTAFFAMTIVIYVVIYYVRKAMVRVSGRDPAYSTVRDRTIPARHPAAGKYISAVVVAMALSESVGIYGVVLFILSRDFISLYLFITISALFMFIYRPRKEELLRMAADMKKQA